jgi:hypothetical protein
MKLLPHITYQIQSVFPFLIILLLLSVLTLIAPYYMDWPITSNVFIMYNIAFSFYYVYIAASDDSSYDIKKSTKFDKIKFIFETRVFPFLVVYLIGVVSSAVLHRGAVLENGAFLIFFDDTTANLVIYSAVLFYMYRLGKKPFITIPLFIAISYSLYYINNTFYDTVLAGHIVVIYKSVKNLWISFFVFWDFKKNIKALLKSLFFALLLSVLFMSSLIAAYSITAEYSKSEIIKFEYNLKLAHYGSEKSIQKAAESAFQLEDIELIERLYPYVQYYTSKLDVQQLQWNKMLYINDLKKSDITALYMLKEGVTIDPGKMIDYALKSTKTTSYKLSEMDNLARLTAQSITDSTTVTSLIATMDNHGKEYMLWVMKVLSEAGNCEAIYTLLNYLPEFDSEISYNAFRALRTLTGVKPDQEQDTPYNSVKSIKMFTDYYQENCTTN